MAASYREDQIKFNKPGKNLEKTWFDHVREKEFKMIIQAGKTATAFTGIELNS
jgi:hypothetical protein